MNTITVSESAQDFLVNLLEKQENTIGVRMFVDNPGTPKAETILTYVKADNPPADVTLEEHGKLAVYLHNDCIKFLEEALVDFNTELGSGTLTIKAPNSKMTKLGEDATLSDKVNYLLWNEVNPGLAAHSGEVNLVEITNDDVAVLSFGGGCQGCAQVDLTLKHGVENTLLESIPELKGVLDVTDHSNKDNAYYK